MVQMGFQRRFDLGYRRARELVESGALGRIYVVRMSGHDPHPPHDDYIPGSGGIFRDLHIHDFDIVRYVTGQDVVEVYADGSDAGFEAFARHGDVAAAVATLRFSGGTLGILSGTRHDPLGYDIRMELFGAGDSVAVGWNDRTPLRSIEPGRLHPHRRDPTASFSTASRRPTRRSSTRSSRSPPAGRRTPARRKTRARRSGSRWRAISPGELHRPVRIEEVG